MEYIEFGKVVNTHALKGEVKIYSYTNDEQNILKLKKIYINKVEYLVEKSRYQKGMFTFKLNGIDSIEKAEELVGNIVQREVKPSEKNMKDEFFVKDLEGLEVFDEQGNLIGILEEVFSTGANDVYTIKGPDGALIYIPAIKRVVKQVDIHARKMIVHNLEGLIWNLQ